MASPYESAEIARSASEASKIKLVDVNLTRYQNPPADTCYPLEYAFYLLGDVKGKLVLDLGCGSGEEVVPLRQKGARVIGIDISPDLIAIAQKRVEKYGLEADLRVGSAYETGLPEHSIDVIFCSAVLHHMDLRLVKNEMLRVLKPRGVLIVEEPIRLSWTMKQLRRLFPAREDVSEFEYPLNSEQLAFLTAGFDLLASRYFRTPALPLLMKFTHNSGTRAKLWVGDNWLLHSFPALEHFATVRVMALREKGYCS